MIRLEVDTAFNTRPKRGERRHKDGRLIKCCIYFGSTLEECLDDARETAKAGQKIAPGYAEVIEVRGYDKEAFHADPFNCKPIHKAVTL